MSGVRVPLRPPSRSSQSALAARERSKPEGDDVTAQTPTRTLQDVLDSVPNLVDFLYSNRKGSVLKDAVLRQPTEFVAPEFTTWRDEQRA